MTLRVCIADDDVDIRGSLRFLFEENEAIVEEAADGETTLALLRREAVPRVLLLDWLMPGLDGVGVLRALAAHPAIHQRTAILFLTAYGATPDTELAELLAKLCVTKVEKPYDVPFLLAQVELAWQRLMSQA